MPEVRLEAAESGLARGLNRKATSLQIARPVDFMETGPRHAVERRLRAH